MKGKRHYWWIVWNKPCDCPWLFTMFYSRKRGREYIRGNPYADQLTVRKVVLADE